MLTKTKVFLLLSVLSLFISNSVSAQQAPGFTLPSDKGNISLKQFQGKVVYLDFWASWCVPCRKSFPWMNDMQKKYASKGLVVLGVNLDESRDDAAAFLAQVPAKFKIAYDSKGVTPGQYKVDVMPTSYLVDRKGNLVSVHQGFTKSKTDHMEKEIQELLGK